MFIIFSFHCSYFFNISCPESFRVGQHLNCMNNWNFQNLVNLYTDLSPKPWQVVCGFYCAHFWDNCLKQSILKFTKEQQSCMQGKEKLLVFSTIAYYLFVWLAFLSQSVCLSGCNSENIGSSGKRCSFFSRTN